MSLLDWPQWAERTPEGERDYGNQFDVGFQRTQKELRQEFERMDVEDWRIEDVTGSGGDPGVVVRWIRNGRDYAAVCDAYSSKGANLRSIYLWINETRMREQRPVQTGGDSFAAAQLPSGNEDAIVTGRPPHEVLGVAPDAPDAVVRGAYRELLKERHPDQGGTKAEFDELQKAKEAMTE